MTKLPTPEEMWEFVDNNDVDDTPAQIIEKTVIKDRELIIKLLEEQLCAGCREYPDIRTRCSICYNILAVLKEIKEARENG